MTIPQTTARHSAREGFVLELSRVLEELRIWVERREYAGFDPYDLLNSPRLQRLWRRSSVLSSLAIQTGRRFAGVSVRNALHVPASINPKAIALFLSAYCDLAGCGHPHMPQIARLKEHLRKLRSPGEREYAWGYDWNYLSMRGGTLPAFAPNSIATVFCAVGLLDLADLQGDGEAKGMAESACRFCVTRLNRSYEDKDEMCLSYTPQDRTLIFNNSVLVAALLARVAVTEHNADFLDAARRCMTYLARRQRHDGSWTYGQGPLQQWVDGFHTGYNLCALAAYRRATEDTSFDSVLLRGYEFYKTVCFTDSGVPKYFHDRLYPIDIHACSQAVLTYCDFAEHDPEALGRAVEVARWTIANMRSANGTFYYQRHCLWTNRTPYMRWGQAWMFRALARLLRGLVGTAHKQNHENLD